MLERKRISLENYFFEKQKNVDYHSFQQMEELISHFNIELTDEELRYLGWLLFLQTQDFNKLPFRDVFKHLNQKIEFQKKDRDSFLIGQ